MTVVNPDITAPFFDIIEPKHNDKIPAGTPLVVRGWAEDRQSGVDALEWQLDGGAFETASQNDWEDWRFEINDLTPGLHSIAVRLRDRQGNPTPLDAKAVVTIEVPQPFTPQDASDLVSIRAYLEDLLLYAQNHINTMFPEPSAS